mmetsp:Transcript_5919/g.17753  ORF Transcript_5919/g.17753 Transcript_5919/m.17753 type:complete len:217 (+) Transcript_5919:216-866(+)
MRSLPSARMLTARQARRQTSMLVVSTLRSASSCSGRQESTSTATSEPSQLAHRHAISANSSSLMRPRTSSHSCQSSFVRIGPWRAGARRSGSMMRRPTSRSATATRATKGCSSDPISMGFTSLCRQDRNKRTSSRHWTQRSMSSSRTRCPRTSVNSWNKWNTPKRVTNSSNSRPCSFINTASNVSWTALSVRSTLAASTASKPVCCSTIKMCVRWA